MNQEHSDNSQGIISRLGPLRVVLSLLVVVLVLLSPFAGMDTDYENWTVIPTIVAPVLVPIVFFVLWLDILMSKVFASQAGSDDQRARFRLITRVHLMALAVLCIAWTPFFITLLG